MRRQTNSVAVSAALLLNASHAFSFIPLRHSVGRLSLPRTSFSTSNQQQQQQQPRMMVTSVPQADTPGVETTTGGTMPKPASQRLFVQVCK